MTKSVEKKYPVSDDIPTGEKFSITVTFGNGSGGPQTGTNYVANGVYTFSLANGAKAEITGIPYGTSYTVDETLTEAQTGAGYSYVSGEVASAKIGALTETVTILNQYYKSPKISVNGTKTWAGEGAPTGAEATITLTGKVNSETVVTKTDKVTVSDPDYSFTELDRYDANGQEISYTVAETGVTVAGKDVSLVDGNKFVVYDETVEATNPTQEYQYQVLGYWTSSVSGTNVTNTWVPAQNQENGTYGFDVYKVDEAGETITSDTATFTLSKQGGTSTEYTTVNGVAHIRDLEPGTYTLTETKAPAGYVGAENSWTITVEHDGKTLVDVQKSGNVFTNIWNWLFNKNAETSGDFAWNGDNNKLTVTNEAITGTITISKTVVDGDGGSLSTDKEFTFEVKKGDSVVDTLEVTTSSSATTKELPYGTYTITETGKADISDYTWSNVTYSGDDVTTQNGVTTVSVTSQDQQIQVAAKNTYTRDTGTLIIEKKIPVDDWAAVEAATGYTGTITATGSGAAVGTVKPLRFSNSSSFEHQGDYYVFSETYHNVPTGSYTITESGADIANYYRTTNVNGMQIYGTGATVTSATVTVNTTNTVEAPATVTVTNDYEIHTHDLSIEKIVSKTSNSVNAPADAAFTFTVKLGNGSEIVTGSDSSADYVENGSYTFTLKANEEAMIKGVPYGVAYEVEETNIPEGFVSNWTDNKSTGTMPDDTLELSCTNTYFKSETINLTVEKTWSGSDDYQGTVTVELWKNNAATGQTKILSASNWSASFNDLPLYDGRNDGEINTYTVHETAVENTPWKTVGSSSMVTIR